MTAKSAIGHERAVMCGKIVDKHLSLAVCDMICQHIGSFPPEDHATRDAEAAKTTAIIESSETEAEIVEKLRAL